MKEKIEINDETVEKQADYVDIPDENVDETPEKRDESAGNGAAVLDYEAFFNDPRRKKDREDALSTEVDVYLVTGDTIQDPKRRIRIPRTSLPPDAVRKSLKGRGVYPLQLFQDGTVEAWPEIDMSDDNEVYLDPIKLVWAKYHPEIVVYLGPSLKTQKKLNNMLLIGVIALMLFFMMMFIL